MGTPTQYYVDPAIDANSGAGTLGDPYGDLQHALDNITRDATNGDQINIKAGTDEVLAARLDFTTYGTGTSSAAPLIFRGYTSAANDGGIGGVDGNGNGIVSEGGMDGLVFWDLHLHNSGSNRLLLFRRYGAVINCELNNASDIAIQPDSAYCHILNCYFHDISAQGILMKNIGIISGCYFKNDGSKDFTYGVEFNGGVNHAYIRNSIFDLDGTSGAILLASTSKGAGITNCSMFTSGTGDAITRGGTDLEQTHEIANNLFEGWNTGVAFGTGDSDNAPIHGNSFFDCSTNLDLGDAPTAFDNEALAETPFKKSGAQSYANRAGYWAPKDVGDVFSPSGGMGGARGAIQPPFARGTIHIRRSSVLGRM